MDEHSNQMSHGSDAAQSALSQGASATAPRQPVTTIASQSESVAQPDAALPTPDVQPVFTQPAPGSLNVDPCEVVPEAVRPGRHHVHHAYVWLGGLRAAIVAAFAIFISMSGSMVGSIADEESDLELPDAAIPFVIGGVALFVLLVVGLIFLIQWLSWKNLTYELGTDEVSVYSGIISKKRMHVPYQRVQAVNQNASLLHRLVGVCDVKIDTAGGAANDGVILKYMRIADAEALRGELFRRKKAILAGGSVSEDGTVLLNGATYYSAWAVASMGFDPQSVPLTAFGYTLQPAAAASAAIDSASGFPIDSVSAVSGLSYDETNVLDAADEIMQDVRGVFGGVEVDTGQVSYETGLSNKELLLAGASGAGESLGLVFLGIVAAVGSVAQLFQGMIERSTESWVVSMAQEDAMVEIGSSFDLSNPDALSSTVGGAALQIILCALLAVVVLWVLSALGTIVRYGGFRLRRREGRVEVESGLLSRSFHGVDVDRVQSVVIKQSFIRRLMGYCELSVLKIDSAAAQSSDAQGQKPAAHGVIIHPFVKMDRVLGIIQGVLPEFADMPAEEHHPAPVGLRRAIVRMSVIRSAAFWFAVFVALCQVAMELVIANIPMNMEELAILSTVRIAMFSYYAIFVLAFVLNVINAILWHRRSGLGYDRSFMSLTNGGFAVKTTYTPRKKIQFAYVRTNPLQRMVHVSSVNVRTAAGVGGATDTLWDLAEQEAGDWMEWVRPRVRKAEE